LPASLLDDNMRARKNGSRRRVKVALNVGEHREIRIFS
jgi:hypothetical protein